MLHAAVLSPLTRDSAIGLGLMLKERQFLLPKAESFVFVAREAQFESPALELEILASAARQCVTPLVVIEISDDTPREGLLKEVSLRNTGLTGGHTSRGITIMLARYLDIQWTTQLLARV